MGPSYATAGRAEACAPSRARPTPPRRRFLARALALPAALFGDAWRPGVQAAPPQVVWVWSGAVTTTSAVVKAKVRRAGRDLHLRYGLDRELRAARRTPLDGGAQPDAHDVVAFALTDLTPNTRYYYAVADGDETSAAGELQTFADGPMSFAFGAASCAGGNLFSTVSNNRIFETILDRRPLFFIHMGDLHYKNLARNDILLFHQAYDAVLTQPRQASLYRRVPIVYMWDDHDYGPNDSNRTSPSRPAARTVYNQVVPHYPLVKDGDAVGTIQQEFTVGRVRFLISDLRSERDPGDAPDGPNKSMLGTKQRAWLDEAFTRAARDEVPLLFWVGSVPWITRIGDKSDGWEPYSWERRWLADRIEALGLTRRIVMISGDAHMVAIDDGTNSNYTSTAPPGTPGFPVLQAAPMDRSPSIKGGPYSHGVSDRNNQFGWVDVRDDGTTITVTLSGLDQAGRVIPGKLLRLECRALACQPVRAG